MLTQPLQEAAQELGNYCPVKNELLVRKGRKTHRFIFGEGQIRIVFPAKTEAVIHVAPDLTVRELQNIITEMSAAMEY